MMAAMLLMMNVLLAQLAISEMIFVAVVVLEVVRLLFSLAPVGQFALMELEQASALYLLFVVVVVVAKAIDWVY
jgi:hypothetical protein